MISEIKIFMRPLLIIALLSPNSACEKLFPPEKRSLDAKLVEKVVRCNKYGTCLVVFADESQGLMTRPEVGIYGCKALTERSYNKCDASEDSGEPSTQKLESYEDFPEYPSQERK